MPCSCACFAADISVFITRVVLMYVGIAELCMPLVGKGRLQEMDYR
jgi:hypothetical protein